MEESFSLVTWASARNVENKSRLKNANRARCGAACENLCALRLLALVFEKSTPADAEEEDKNEDEPRDRCFNPALMG